MTGLLLQKKTQTYGLALGVLLFSIIAGTTFFPNGAFAADDPVPGRGWTCTASALPAQGANAGTTTCRPTDNSQTWQRTCTQDGAGGLNCNVDIYTGNTTNIGNRTYTGQYFTNGTTANPQGGFGSNGQPGGEVNEIVAGSANGFSITEAGAEAGGAVVDVGLGTVLGPFTVMFWLAFKIGSFMLGLAGVLFNWTVGALVFQFAKYLGNSPGMLVAWQILRDFGNIGLLFGFVFMGISTILDLHSYPWKKALPSLVIFAVLLNFSLFAAEAVIDTTNVLAATLYDASVADSSTCNAMVDAIDCLINNGIAGEFLTRLQISSTFDENSPGEFVDGVLNQFGDPIGNLLRFVGLATVTTIAAVVLFAGAIMLLSRAVILAFLMVTSPIGFAGMAIPGLQGLAGEWWKKLIDQALFAPVFILLLLVALKMTDGVNQLASNSGGLAGAFSTNEPGSTGILLLFALIVGFMLGALILASKFGIYGASFAANSASALVFGTVTRGTNFIAGGVASRLNRAIIKSPTLQNNKFARGLSSLVLTPAIKSNIDVRKAPGVSALLGVAGIKEGAKPAEHASYYDMAHIYDDYKDEGPRKRRETAFNAAVKTQTLEDNAHRDDGHGAPLDKASIDHMNDMSEQQLLQLHGIKSGLRSMAANLKPEKFDALMKSKDLDDATKEELRANRKEYLTNTPNGATVIRNMKPEVIVKLPASIYTNKNVMNVMNARQFGRIEPNDLDATDLRKVVDHLNSQKASGSPQWSEFYALAQANPTIKRKWGGHVDLR